jgi:oxygen-dependent protoporphyrinogen oxidase
LPAATAENPSILSKGTNKMNSAPPGADVVVIGAGISGLACALWLQSRGARVTVLEKNAAPGGAMGSVRDGGYLVEQGPNSALETTPLFGELFAAAGVATDKAVANPESSKRFVLRGGRLIPLPMSPPAFLATPLFSLGAKLRLFREPFIGRGEGEETVAQFVRRRLGPEFLDYAINPFVSGVYAGDPERLSVPAAFPRLAELEAKYGSLIRGQIQGARERKRRAEQSKQSAPMFSFREGMATLPSAIAAKLADVRLGVGVESLERAGDGYRMRGRDEAGNAVDVAARSVVLAMPAHATEPVLQPLAPDAADALAGIEYPPVAVVALGYRRVPDMHPLDGFGFLVPAKENRRILGTLFSSTLFPGRAPEGHALLTSFVGGMRQPDLARLPESELVAMVADEQRQLLSCPATPEYSRVTFWPKAIPQYAPGHLLRMERLARAEEELPGLYFCANYRGGISVGDCVKSAHAMAERVARFLGVGG